MNVRERGGLGLHEGAGVTLAEAKRRWANWTKTVLTDEARKSCQKVTWEINPNGVPIARSLDCRYVFAFYRDENGKVYGQDKR